MRQLGDIVENLREVFHFPEGGDKPLRSQGSRWISHKRAALQRLVDRYYGAYISHLTSLVEDKTIPSTDRARLKGCLAKWQQAKMLIGAALYVDALKPASLLIMNLQEDNISGVARG